MNKYSRDGLSIQHLRGSAFRAWPSLGYQYSASGQGEQILKRVTVGYKNYLKLCNPSIKFSIPKRTLTNPSEAYSNDGHDNIHNDLILRTEEVLFDSKKNNYYIIEDMLGKGTFGQVVKCRLQDSNSYFAIKIIKNCPAYNKQCQTEIKVLNTLQKYIQNLKLEQEGGENIIQLKDSFICHRHLCLVFPLMAYSLLDVLKHNHYEGFKVKLVRQFIQQIVKGLVIAESTGVVHADLKPENIMIEKKKPLEESTLKIIDFGSSCFMNDKSPYIYIQSRFYRAPEIIMRHKQYTNKIDMWSLGCIAVELLSGTALFPCAEEYSCIERILQVTKQDIYPCSYQSTELHKYFTNEYLLKSREQFEKENKTIIRGCFDKLHPISSLTDLKQCYEAQLDYDQGIGQDIKGLPEFRTFLDFIQRCLKWDPQQRISAEQAQQHAFLNNVIKSEINYDFLWDDLDTQNDSSQSSSSNYEDQFNY